MSRTALILYLTLMASSLHAQSSATTNTTTTAAERAAQYRLKWNTSTLLGGYEQHGQHNPKWDVSAKEALTNFVLARSALNSATAITKLSGAVKTALTNGCTDPLIHYLQARFVLASEEHTQAQHNEAYRLAAEGLAASDYPAVLKFYAALRAADALNPGGGKPTPPEVHRWRRAASGYLNEAVRDRTMPVTEVYDACEQLMESVQYNQKQFEEFYRAFEPVIFTNWPGESSLYMLRGWFYIKYAWHARGGDYSDKVSEQGWTLFGERLVEAEKALAKAWELDPHDPRTARHMMTVELGQGKGRQRMELWFKRATDLNPNYYDAFTAKLRYLEPKWYGTPEDMLEFGRECVASKKWGGHVPLVLRDAHEALAGYLPKEQQTAYWKRADVWKDLKAAFDKYFELNPGDVGWHHNYARYAYRAGDWDVLNRQLPLLGPINYEFFGGKQAFDEMVREAKERRQVERGKKSEN